MCNEWMTFIDIKFIISFFFYWRQSVVRMVVYQYIRFHWWQYNVYINNYMHIVIQWPMLSYKILKAMKKVMCYKLFNRMEWIQIFQIYLSFFVALIKCRDLVKKIAIYKTLLAVGCLLLLFALIEFNSYMIDRL